MGKERPFDSSMDTRTAKSQLKKLLAHLEKDQIPYKKILVFGSHVKGLATKTSDLDVCLVFPKKVKDADIIAGRLRYMLGRLYMNIDLSSVYENELKENKLSGFINELKTSSMTAEDFLLNTPKTFEERFRKTRSS